MPLYVKRVTPDPRWFAAIVAAVENFERTAADMIAGYDAVTEGMRRQRWPRSRGALGVTAVLAAVARVVAAVFRVFAAAADAAARALDTEDTRCPEFAPDWLVQP